MALSAAAKLALSLSVNLSNPQNLTGGVKKASDNIPYSFSNGNGNGQIQAEWDDYRTIAASGTDTLDLFGVLQDVFGNTIDFANIKALVIAADAANTNNVNVGGAAANAVPIFGDVTDVVPVQPGGLFVWVAPNVGAHVSSATGDQLKIANSGAGTPVSYKIYIFGTAALIP